MKRLRIWIVFLILTLSAARGALATPGNQSDVQPGAPKPIVVPETAANRMLLAAVLKTDIKAVSAAFQQGADPNAAFLYTDSAAASKKQKPTHIFFLIAHRITPENKSQAIQIFRQFLERGADPKARANDESGDNTLTSAIALEDVDLLRMVLDKGGDASAVMGNPAQGPTGNAVNFVLQQTNQRQEERLLPLLSLVLERGADPNLYDNSGMTPLQRAALFDMPQSARILLQYGADPSLFTRTDGQPGNGQRMFPYKATALMLATVNGAAEVIKMLKAAKPDLPVEEAAATGDAAALSNYLESGVNPNQRDARGYPFLVLAAASGNPEAVRVLLKHKADPNAKEINSGTTALIRAASLGHGDVIRTLLRAGADPNLASATSRFPRTALISAVQQAQPDSVTALLESPRLDLNAPGNRDALLRSVQGAGGTVGRTSGQSFKAVKQGDVLLDAQDRIYAMLAARSDIQKMGGPAFCLAVSKGQFGIAEDLLQRGADVNARDPEGKTVLMLTVENIGMSLDSVSPQGIMGEHLTLAEKKARRAEVEAQNKEALAFFRLLFGKKPDVNAVSTSDYKTGNTALSLAQLWKVPEAVILLKRAGARR